MNKYFKIVELTTGNTVWRIDVTSRRQIFIDELDKGVNENLNDKYFTVLSKGSENANKIALTEDQIEEYLKKTK